MSKIKLSIKEEELELLVSSLLFSSSVNIVSNTEEAYQKQLIDLAVKLKNLKPDLNLKDIQFIEEENYEDKWSEEIFENFKENIEIINFEHI
jgi:hypothetical protein